MRELNKTKKGKVWNLREVKNWLIIWNHQLKKWFWVKEEKKMVKLMSWEKWKTNKEIEMNNKWLKLELKSLNNLRKNLQKDLTKNVNLMQMRTKLKKFVPNITLTKEISLINVKIFIIRYEKKKFLHILLCRWIWGRIWKRKDEMSLKVFECKFFNERNNTDY